jgi:hypothetical protein
MENIVENSHSITLLYAVTAERNTGELCE